jgi:hypothetical protein
MKIKSYHEFEFQINYDYEEDTDISDAKVDLTEIKLNGVDVTAAILADPATRILLEEAAFEREISRPDDLAAQREDYEYARRDYA